MRLTRILAVLLFLPSVVVLSQDDKATPQNASSGVQTDQGPAPSVLLLDDVIREALEKNPEAQSALHTVKAMQRRVPQVESLPDPMASVGWAGNPAPFSIMQGDNSSYRGLTVSEQFPYPGKLKLRGQIASKEADAAQTDYDAIRRKVTAESKIAYYEYFYYDRAIQTTTGTRNCSKSYRRLLRLDTELARPCSKMYCAPRSRYPCFWKNSRCWNSSVQLLRPGSICSWFVLLNLHSHRQRTWNRQRSLARLMSYMGLRRQMILPCCATTRWWNAATWASLWRRGSIGPTSV